MHYIIYNIYPSISPGRSQPDELDSFRQLVQSKRGNPFVRIGKSSSSSSSQVDNLPEQIEQLQKRQKFIRIGRK